MSELDSQIEQGSSLRDINPIKDCIAEGISANFLSQSEEDLMHIGSETSCPVSDQKAAKVGKKRSLKAKGKNKDELWLEEDSSTANKKSKSSGRRKKKTEQYKNQVIVDQYGTFEYDKDPEGYKKARKRQQNRESALRARDKRANKMETVESRLQKIEAKSSEMEKENMVLKAEKRQLQDQVKNLLSIITSFGATKRIKTGEQEEWVRKADPQMISTDTPDEVKEEEVFSLEGKDYDDTQSLSPKNNSPEETMLRLIRNNNDSIFDQEEGGFGDILQKGLMLSLTIVMWMVLCLTGYSVSEYYSGGSPELWNTCSASKMPFELGDFESRALMSHPQEAHYISDGHSSESKLLFNLWVGVFMIMVLITTFFLRKQRYFLSKPKTVLVEVPIKA